MLRMIRGDGHRDLMRAESSLIRDSVHQFGSRPTLRGLKNNHGPAWLLDLTVYTSLMLDAPDILDGIVEGRRHSLMHKVRLVSHNEKRFPSASAQELQQFFLRDAREDGRIGNLIAVQM